MSKKQVFIAKGSSPWYLNTPDWEDIVKITNIDKSISGQVTVTCNGSVTDMASMFSGCRDLTSIDLSSFDTSNAVGMALMFCDCEKLTTIKGVIDMESCEDCFNMFKNCSNLSGVKIKNPPTDFESKTGLSSSQYVVVNE